MHESRPQDTLSDYSLEKLGDQFSFWMKHSIKHWNSITQVSAVMSFQVKEYAGHKQQ